MYIETISNNSGGDDEFQYWERFDIILISNNYIFCNRFSIFTIDDIESMGRFRIQLLIGKTQAARYTMERNTKNSSVDFLAIRF